MKSFQQNGIIFEIEIKIDSSDFAAGQNLISENNIKETGKETEIHKIL